MIHSAGVRVSAPRIAIMDYLLSLRTHPAADEIYSALRPGYPSLSRTTVYNSLHTLVKAGLLRLLEIESGVMRYDVARQQPHGHFLCRGCHTLYDIPLPQSLPLTPDGGFTVDSVEYNCKGLCPACSAKPRQH